MRARRAGLLAGLVVAVVLGIVGMHGLSGAHALAPGDQMAMSHQGHQSGHQPGHSGMVMLCASMLVSAGALVLLLFARARGRSRRPAPCTGAATSGRFARTARVAARPPPTWEFSVIRC